MYIVLTDRTGNIAEKSPPGGAIATILINILICIDIQGTTQTVHVHVVTLQSTLTHGIPRLHAV